VVNGPVERSKRIGVSFLDSHGIGLKTHVDLASLIRDAMVDIALREPEGHAADPIPEARQLEAHLSLCMPLEPFGQLHV
jgi:hypothetical protein